MKKKIKASTIVTTGIVSTVAIASGLAVGILVGKMMSAKGAPADEIYVDPALEDDYDALMKRYEEDPSISNFRDYELANISWLKFAQETHTHTISHGTVDAGLVKQKIFAHDVRKDNQFFTESLSYSGIKKCGVRFYQDDSGVTEYVAKDIKENGTATWDENKSTSVSLEKHEDSWGKTLDRPVIYIISDATVLKESRQESNGGYIIDLDLDPSKSVLRYIKQMISISNLEDAPEFHHVHLQFTLDADLNLDTFVVEESYTVFVFGRNDSSATLTQKFYHTSDEEIPELHENYNY